MDFKNNNIRRYTSHDYSVTHFGKVPPQARELEQVVLGAILIEKNAFLIAGKILDAECFYVDAHCAIYESMQNLFIQGVPIDLLTVIDSLGKMGKLEQAGGAHYLSNLTNLVGSAANIEYHCRIIYQKHIMRELIKISNDVTVEAYDDTQDCFEVLADAQMRMRKLTEKLNSSKTTPISSAIDDALSNMVQTKEIIQQNPGKILGITSGLKTIDKITDGFLQGDLIVLAAGPSEGKSTLMLQSAEEAAIDEQVLVFSLEMTTEQLVWKIFNRKTGIPVSDIRKGNLTDAQWEQLHAIKNYYCKNDNLHIHDEAGIDITDLCNIARTFYANNNIKAIYIDYLQLITTYKSRINFSNREREVTHISHELKRLAKDLQIPVIALSQLNRSQENNKRLYKLSDLRESGAIEQDADTVMFVFRPSYHRITQLNDRIYSANCAIIIIAKQRLGKTGIETVKFSGAKSKFFDECDWIPEYEISKETESKESINRTQSHVPTTNYYERTDEQTPGLRVAFGDNLDNDIF